MNIRLDALRVFPCEQLDSETVSLIQSDNDTEKTVEEFYTSHMALLRDSYSDTVKKFLIEIQSFSDYELVRSFAKNFTINPFSDVDYASRNIIISKVNHGFWEHFACLHAEREHISTYRDVNLKLRTVQYQSGGFLDLLIASLVRTLANDDINKFISCTTGIEPFERALGVPYSTDSAEGLGSYALSPFKRGAVRGLLAFSHFVAKAYGIAQPLEFYDSYSNNASFQKGIIFEKLLATAQPKSVFLIMGPPMLRQVRINNWHGRQAYLAVSLKKAMSDWKLNLKNLFSVLKYYSSLKVDVVILFQGAVLGPVVASFVQQYRKNLDINVSFLDFGRLLDTAFGYDVTKTGSPLPNNTYSSSDQLVISEAPAVVFLEHSPIL